MNLNNINCYKGNTKWEKKDLSNNGLFVNFNMHNDTNTRSFQEALKKLKELGYTL